ncbi:hypothetical protein MAR_027834 [Mya arenaria]|uniref:Uncharacterized protein n=1 Tax=Mya arenaria TaxID=6604 RepID=A0ABY7EYZ3_MYAAR|nr:hypothetical protein MAR_027834 [Mya arenaria]
MYTDKACCSSATQIQPSRTGTPSAAVIKTGKTFHPFLEQSAATSLSLVNTTAIRKHDGTEYEPVNFSTRKYELISHSNQVLISKRKHLKAQVKGNLKSKAEPLTKEEFQKLRDRKLFGKERSTL